MYIQLNTYAYIHTHILADDLPIYILTYLAAIFYVQYAWRIS